MAKTKEDAKPSTDEVAGKSVPELARMVRDDPSLLEHPDVKAAVGPEDPPNPALSVPVTVVQPYHTMFGTDQFNRPLRAPRATTDNEERERLAAERARIDKRNEELNKERATGEKTMDEVSQERAALAPTPPPLKEDGKEK
jgi:type IV secretory pathway VirB10-like protein